MEQICLTLEGHCQRLWGLRWGESARSLLFAQRILDSARSWLQPDWQDPERIVEQVALEQFMAVMPASTVNWLQCHRPETLAEIIRLAEKPPGRNPRGPLVVIRNSLSLQSNTMSVASVPHAQNVSRNICSRLRRGRCAYNWRTRLHHFRQAIRLLPTSQSKLLAKWQGPRGGRL
ncbi:zinc finger protein 202-like [Scleropages formosus]|uniref:zinc finger protein 202-like n=1 Tax=Scleropages formosus TaxID=113540 RepID=UPI000878277D|nr:zinc finger protein 202-like [Scleropages formosus]